MLEWHTWFLENVVYTTPYICLCVIIFSAWAYYTWKTR